MIERFLYVLSRSKKTQIWIVIAFVFPTLTLLIGVAATKALHSELANPLLANALGARLTRYTIGVALAFFVASIVQAVRCFIRDWKRY